MQSSRKRQILRLGICGSSASIKFFVWAFAGVPQALLSPFLAFATPLQMPRKTFWCLQHCCKCLKKLSGVCNAVANASKNFLVFATLLQVPQKTFWRLQRRCKCLKKLSGVCNTVASASKNFLAFATLLQAAINTVCDRYRGSHPPTAPRNCSLASAAAS